MLISYSLNDADFERQAKVILDIKNENVQLKTNFIEYIKIYGTILGIFALISLLYSKAIYFSILIVILFFVSIIVLFFFQFYQIEYDYTQESLVLKKWYGNTRIPKKNLKKVYIKRAYKAGTHLYINYIDDGNKEKYILLDIFSLKINEIREFLDIFIIKSNYL